MTVDEFRLLAKGEAPQGLSSALLALYHDERGDWDAAHESAQAGETRDGAWVHAYLHRKEGDVGNAGYWYRSEPAVPSQRAASRPNGRRLRVNS